MTDTARHKAGIAGDADPIVKPGALVIRRSIFIAAPPARVWREFETFERFSGWFGVMVDEYDRRSGKLRPMGHKVVAYEPHEGGSVEMEVGVEGAVRRFGGRVRVFDPPRELTFEDSWIPNEAGWTAPLLLTLRLTPSGGGTVVELLQHGFENIGASAAEDHRGHEQGWSTRQLEALRNIVESG